MAEAESSCAVAQTARCVTGIADRQLLFSELDEDSRLGWQRVIDEKLIEWACDPSYLEDEEHEVPSRAAIASACQVARQSRDHRAPPPSRVVPDGDGGIVFGWRQGSLSETIEIDRDGGIEWIAIDDSCRVYRQRFR